MQQGRYGLKVLGDKIDRWFVILMLCILMTSSAPAVAGDGDIRWNFLFTLQFLENHRDEIIQAIMKLLSSRQNVLMNSGRYHRMTVMRPRETVKVQQSPVKKHPPSREPSAGVPLDDIGDLCFEMDPEPFGSQGSQGSQPGSPSRVRRNSEMRFFIERDFADEVDSETSSVTTERRLSGTPDVFSVSPVRLNSMDTGQLYDQSEARRRARARRRRTPSELDVRDDVDADDSPPGWFIPIPLSKYDHEQVIMNRWTRQNDE